MAEATDTGLRALRWLFEHGGEGVIDKNGAIIAQGERTKHLAETWLRLVATGHLVGSGKSRIALTNIGRALAAQQPAQSRSGDGILDKFERTGSPDPLGEYADGEIGYVR